MSSQVLLLDFDGVVFTNRRMLSRVSNRVASFVRRKVNPDWSHAQAVQANEFLYKNYGHTWKGLTSLYEGYRKLPITEYNKDVYDTGIIKHTRRCVNEDTRSFKYLQSLCKKYGIPIYIVSNSPMVWVKSLNDVMGLGIPSTHIFTSDHDVIDGVIKPDMQYYHRAVACIREQEGLRYDVEFVVVDDSFNNLQPLVNIQGFRPVLLGDVGATVHGSTRLACVSSLEDIGPFLCDNKQYNDINKESISYA